MVMPAGHGAAKPEPTCRPLFRDDGHLPPSLLGCVVVPAHLHSAPTPAGLMLFATKTCAVVFYKQVAKLELDCNGKYWVRPPLSNVCPTVINIDFVQLKYSYTI